MNNKIEYILACLFVAAFIVAFVVIGNMSFDDEVGYQKEICERRDGEWHSKNGQYFCVIYIEKTRRSL